ncbi:SRPBCC family protein [Thermomonospora sp. CIF 1]|uniref:SRPBCC family protein n=1 Tax=Thermomonospora sp. CIF 1 TaxID=1916083 RepID=UPI000CA9AF5A|nr:SRPBCC family protein [Thermomonospora sp. CIF 1]PKK12759.1 MAG: MxaD family protein [Thermomonospora sp. CIF 1]
MQYTIDLTATSSAPPEVLFAHVAVAEAWPVWSGLPGRARRIRPGVGTGDGVGAVRQMGPAREEAVLYEPPTRYAYRMLAGLPVDGYRADVTFRARPEGGTAVRWQACFTRRIPGTGALMKAVLTRLLSRAAEGLARHAEHCPPSCPARRPR